MKIRHESKAVQSESNQTSCFLGNDHGKVFVSAAVSITNSGVWSWQSSCVYMSARRQARVRCFLLTDAISTSEASHSLRFSRSRLFRKQGSSPYEKIWKCCMLQGERMSLLALQLVSSLSASQPDDWQGRFICENKCVNFMGVFGGACDGWCFLKLVLDFFPLQGAKPCSCSRWLVFGAGLGRGSQLCCCFCWSVPVLRGGTVQVTVPTSESSVFPFLDFSIWRYIIIWMLEVFKY